MILAVAAPGAGHDPAAAIMMAATHLPPALTVGPAISLTLVLAWYWRRLASPTVPASRRRIRRWSIVLMIIAMPAIVAGFSFIDGDVDHARYVLVWSGAFALLLLVFLSAIADAMNNLRLHAAQTDEEAVEAAGELVEAFQSRRASLAAAKPGLPRNPAPSVQQDAGSS